MNHLIRLCIVLSLAVSLLGCSERRESDDFFCYGTSFTHKNNVLVDSREEKRTYSIGKKGIADYQCDFSERTILCRSDSKSSEGVFTKELIINRKFRFVVEIETLMPRGSANNMSSQVIYEAKCDQGYL